MTDQKETPLCERVLNRIKKCQTKTTLDKIEFDDYGNAILTFGCPQCKYKQLAFFIFPRK